MVTGKYVEPMMKNWRQVSIFAELVHAVQLAAACELGVARWRPDPTKRTVWIPRDLPYR